MVAGHLQEKNGYYYIVLSYRDPVSKKRNQPWFATGLTVRGNKRAAEKLLAPLERAGVPVRQGTLVLSIALRFVPTLSQEAENIVAAQTARGADLENKGALAYARACVPLIVPLFASALRHADNLGRAMDARCYTGGTRTHYHVMRLDPRRDGAACLALALYLAALVALRLA